MSDKTVDFSIVQKKHMQILCEVTPSDLFLVFVKQFRMKSHDNERTPIILDNDEMSTPRPEGYDDATIRTRRTPKKDATIQTELTAIMLADLERNDRRKIRDENSPNHSELRALVHDGTGLSNSLTMVHQHLDEEENVAKKHMAIALKNFGNSAADPMTKNRRIVKATIETPNFVATNILNDVKANLGPIVGYASQSLLPLYKACAPLIGIVHEISFYVEIALDETSEQPPDGLTIDESAAIRLYTLEWEAPHHSLYRMLNYTLMSADRKELQPYFKYLKLLLTALAKLPCVPSQTVWRGVTRDLSAEFPPGTAVTWWAFSSCTTTLSILENNIYLGSTGNRTLFSVEAINGRRIRAHSHFDTEDEILLLPGTYMIVQSQFSPAPDLHVVHLKQVRPESMLLEPPFEGMKLLFTNCTSSVSCFSTKVHYCIQNMSEYDRICSRSIFYNTFHYIFKTFVVPQEEICHSSLSTERSSYCRSDCRSCSGSKVS